jgi:hypothetical protein
MQIYICICKYLYLGVRSAEHRLCVAAISGVERLNGGVDKPKTRIKSPLCWPNANPSSPKESWPDMLAHLNKLTSNLTAPFQEILTKRENKNSRKKMILLLYTVDR